MNKKRALLEKSVENVFLIAALIAVVSVVGILFFILMKGLPAIQEIGLFNFVLGQKWKPSAELYGIFPMILTSIYATAGAIAFGVPVGILTAVFMVEIAPEWLQRIIRPTIELLAGIPSVVYGFFGLLVFVPIIDGIWDNGGNSLLAAIMILGIMILPTIITVTETALRSVPKEYKEGALALGATHMQTIFGVMVPAAKSGILAAVVLGIGRAVGETMAVILVAGNSTLMPTSVLDRVRTMTANIAMEMGYAFGLHQEALFATGVVLLVFIMLLNILLSKLTGNTERS
ncbi:phosphate ABC transporter permease subunit PstC [Fusibacter sp. A1]|nr:phosphate ABC transporter permease subunit PstC [Fusibacter sp. A2]NPE23502.1 phosphate ABC transporter permease subunit PstC [Fusibacter sp. A1]RXV59137.1 phosphate ABC transporter permease subunit PstC [Fusibacter sp. A1]